MIVPSSRSLPAMTTRFSAAPPFAAKRVALFFKSTRLHQRLPAIVLIAIAFGFEARPLMAQGSVSPAAKKDDRPARLVEMREIATSFQAAKLDGETRVPAVLAGEPLYRWNDPTREFSDGTLWFWRAAGQPIGVVAIEFYPQNKAFGIIWNLEFTSLATGPIEVEGGKHFDNRYNDLAPPRPDGRLRWAPSKGGIELRELPSAPEPAGTDAERLRQMRDILKRFSARELFHSQEYALRLISHPIDRYADAGSGLVDGAIFLYANGTNPEVLLLVEVHRRRAGRATWWYAGAPLARAVVTLRLDRQDVWSHTSKQVPSPQDIYFLARKPRDDPSGD